MNEGFLRVRGIAGAKLTKDTSVVLFGNLVSSALAVVFTILAARLLGPENWGIIAAIGSLLTIFVAIGDLGLTAALFRFVSKKWVEGKKNDVASTIKTVWTLRVLSALFFSVILLIFAKSLAETLLKTGESIFIVLTAVGFLGALFIDFQIALSEAKQEWKKAAVFISLTNLLRVLLLFLIGFGNLTLVNVTFIFTGSSIFAYFLSLLWQKTPIGLVPEWRKTVRELLPFSGFMGVNRMASSFASRVDVLLLIQIAGAYEAGIYGAANRLAIGVPLVLGSFATVLAPKFASLTDGDQSKFFKRSLGLSTVITAGLIFGIFMAPAVVSLFGPDYAESGPVLQLLFLSFVPASLSVPAVNFVIYAMHKPQIITALSLVQLLLVVSLNIWLIPRLGITAPAFALLASNTLTLVVAFPIAWWELRRRRLVLSYSERSRRRAEG